MPGDCAILKARVTVCKGTVVVLTLPKAGRGEKCDAVQGEYENMEQIGPDLSSVAFWNTLEPILGVFLRLRH